ADGGATLSVDGAPALPAWVVLQRDGRFSTMALPISVSDPFTSTCYLDLRSPVTTGREKRRGAGRPLLSLPEGRRVGRALYLMMESGKIDAGLGLAKTASELLQAKYSDPIAAAYGALM